MERKKFSLTPLSGGITPRRSDTPRTQFRKDICQKRLSYFNSVSQVDDRSKCISQEDKPVNSSVCQTSSSDQTSVDKHSRKKQHNIDDNSHNAQSTVYLSDSDKLTQHLSAWESTQPTPSRSIRNQRKEDSFEGGNKTGFSFHPDSPGDHFTSRPTERRFREDGETHGDRYHPMERRQPMGPRHNDSDEVDLGLSTHRPSYSPLRQPTDSMARLSLEQNSHRRYMGESLDSSVAPSYDRFDPADLESVLGAERYERLLSNFNESHETLSTWTDAAKSTDRFPVGDREPGARRTRKGPRARDKTVVNEVHINGGRDCGRVSDNDDDDSTYFVSHRFHQTMEQQGDSDPNEDLGLKTHRADGHNSRDFRLSQGECGSGKSNAKVPTKDSVRCSFSVSEIYAEADKLNSSHGLSKNKFSASQNNPVHKVDYRDSVGVSMNVFEGPARNFGRGQPSRRPFSWEDDGPQDAWQEREYLDVTSGSHGLEELVEGGETKLVDSATTARKSVSGVESSVQMAEGKNREPEKHTPAEVRHSTAQRKSSPSMSDGRLDYLQSAETWSGSGASSLERYFSSLENLSKGSNNSLLAEGFEPIPDPPLHDLPRVKKKQSETCSDTKRMPPQRKSTDSLRSSRSSLQRKGKKVGKSKTTSKGKGQNGAEKPSHQMSLESDDWDISDATSRSFAWSEQNTEAVSKLDPVRQQRNWTSTAIKSQASAALGSMSYADINASRDTDDQFTDVSSLVLSEASSLQDWVIGRTERRSGEKSGEGVKPSTQSKQDDEEGVDRLQRCTATFKSDTAQQRSKLAEDSERDTKSGRPGGRSEKFADGDIRGSSKNTWQEDVTHTLMRICPECRAQNGEFETWCRDCRCILAHVAPTPVPTGTHGGSHVSPDADLRQDRDTLSNCSWYNEDVERSPRERHDVMASDDLRSVTVSYLHGGSSRHQDDTHGRGLEGSGPTVSVKGKDEPVESGLPDGNGDMANAVSCDQNGFYIASSSHNVVEDGKPDIPLQLRISLDSSMDSRSGRRLDMSDRQDAVWRNAARISEAGEFEYRKSVSANIDLPEEVRQELSLDLRTSQDSTVTAGDGKSRSAQAPVKTDRVIPNEAGARAAWPAAPEPADQHPSGQDDKSGDDSREDLDYPTVDPPAYNDHNFIEDRNDVIASQNHLVDPVGDVNTNRQDNGDRDDDDVAVVDSNYHSFINWLIADPQFHTAPATGVAIPQPKKSKGRPKTAGHVHTEKSRSSVSQRSLSKSSYKKKWASSRPSVSASFSYDDFARNSGSTGSSKKRPSSAKTLSTSGVSVSQSRDEGKGNTSERHSQIASARASGRQRTKNSVNKSRSLLRSNPSPTLQAVSETDHDGMDMLTVQSAPVIKGSPLKSLFSTIDPYALYIAMSPRIEAGDVSLWLCLPDEILLHILSFLTLPDLANCARTCKQFHRVAADGSLWKSITLKKRHDLYDDWLIEIGRKRPQRLVFEHCHGDYVTANGLRELFRDCAESLQELGFAGCSRGHLTGDNLLLHAASRCRNISHLDASWCNINDNGVTAICDASHQLHSLCLNGCQALSDETIHKLVTKHGIYLRRLELYGCFNVTARSMASLANNCKGLVTLNLGQCWKVTDNSISQLSASLGMVEHLDIRGCKQIRDMCIHHIMKNCPRLVKFSIANCPNITDGTLAEIATYATQIRSLDVCGCHNVTDVGVKAIATCCQQLELLDLSSTRATHRSVSVLATSSTGHLQVLKVSFCKNITLACLTRLVRNCKRLTGLLLYGISSLRNLDELRTINPRLTIEM